MTTPVETGIIRGRPYGGLMTLISNDLRKVTNTIFASDRYVIVRVFNYLLVNVYFPCSGTKDRLTIIDGMITELSVHLSDYSDCSILIGGDFNSDLDSSDQANVGIHQFLTDFNLCRCDQGSAYHKTNTYVNEALNCGSCLDYFLLSANEKWTDFRVIDEGSNLSDHLPIVVKCFCDYTDTDLKGYSQFEKPCQSFLRWDHAETGKYYLLTGQQLQSLSYEFISEENKRDNKMYYHYDKKALINSVYDSIVNILCSVAEMTVPKRHKQFYKFWWDQELDCLKHDSVVTHKLWKSVGKPRSGVVFNKYRASKLLYKKRIREHQQQETESYSNDLHEALLKKQGTMFWKTWRAKFECGRNQVSQIDGVTDATEIVKKFENYFLTTYTPLTDKGSSRLKVTYENTRLNYCGLPFDEDLEFDVELVDKAIRSLCLGKAPGLDSLTAEHLQYSHPVLVTLLTKLFNLMVSSGYVPEKFGHTYTVPIPKVNNANLSRSLSVDDFRGISISSVVSKVFEKCILERYERFFETTDNQFGFKKEIGCSHAIYSVKSVVNHYVNQGSTVNLCALDLRKAFDKMNHHGLFIKLMEKLLPNNLLSTIEHWFSIGTTCIRWGDTESRFINLNCGVRQGGVLSPYFFALYIDDIVKLVSKCNFGCKFKSICMSVFLYADDIILLAPSVSALQTLLNVCEKYLASMDMALNSKKSCCIRFGPRYDSECCQLVTSSGEFLSWVSNCRYLGVYFESSRYFKCNLQNNRRAFYRSFNAIFSKIGRFASEDVIINLIYMKCVPVLLYGTDAVPVLKRENQSMDFVMTRVLMKLFRTGSISVIRECESAFGLRKMSTVISERKHKFLFRYVKTSNLICHVMSSKVYEDLNAVSLVQT